MATITQTLANTSGFIPQAWANEALDVLRSRIVLAKLVARDSDFSTPGWKGQTLNIPYPGTFAAQDKTPGAVATVQAPSNGAAVNVTLSKHKTVDYILEDVALTNAQSGVNMMQAYGSAAGVALAEVLESDLIGQYTNLALSPIGYGAGVNIDDGSLRSAMKALTDAKAPKADRFILTSTKDINALRSSSLLQNYFAFSAPQTVQSGAVGTLYGADVFDSQLVPVLNATNNVQTVTITGAPTGGTFTLTYGAQTTASLAYNATAAQIQAALGVLTSLTVGTVQVSGTGPFTVTILAASPTALTATASLTGGTSPGVTIANSTVAATVNLALHKNAFILAMRPFAELPGSNAGVEVATANDPVSGISLRVQMQYQPQYRGVYIAYDVLYGISTLRANQGVALIA